MLFACMLLSCVVDILQSHPHVHYSRVEDILTGMLWDGNGLVMLLLTGELDWLGQGCALVSLGSSTFSHLW